MNLHDVKDVLGALVCLQRNCATLGSSPEIGPLLEIHSYLIDTDAHKLRAEVLDMLSWDIISCIISMLDLAPTTLLQYSTPLTLSSSFEVLHSILARVVACCSAREMLVAMNPYVVEHRPCFRSWSACIHAQHRVLMSLQETHPHLVPESLLLPLGRVQSLCDHLSTASSDDANVLGVEEACSTLALLSHYASTFDTSDASMSANMIIFLFELLSLLAYIPVEQHQSWEHAASIIKLLCKCGCDCSRALPRVRNALLLKLQDDNKQSKQHEANYLGECMYMYVVFVVHQSLAPSIIRPVYAWDMCRHHVRFCLSSNQHQLRMKGSHLLHMLSQRVPEHSITYNAIEASAQLECFLNENIPITTLLLHHAARCADPTERAKVVAVFRAFLACFSHHARYVTYSALLRSQPLQTVVCLLLLMIKDEVLKATNGSEEHKAFYTGQQLMALLSIVITIDQGTDLDADFEKLVATANFIRFLLLRGRPSPESRVSANTTGIWHSSILSDLESKFILPLHDLVVKAKTLKLEQIEMAPHEESPDAVAPHFDNASTLMEVDLDASKPKVSSMRLLQDVTRFELLSDILLRIKELLIDGRQYM